MRRRFFTVSDIKFDYNNYMTIEAISQYVNVSIPREIMYGINGIGWNEYKGNSTGEFIRIKKGDLLSIKSNILAGEIFGHISIEGNYNLKGNCLSLVFGDKADRNNDLTNYPYVFYYLFSNTKVINVDTNFLPETTLTEYCYAHMFYGCTSLVEAPELPATQLANYCYLYMFYGCTSLNYIKMLATDVSATNCLSNWVSGVSPTGTFVKSKDATWDVRGASGIPNGWTVETE